MSYAVVNYASGNNNEDFYFAANSDTQCGSADSSPRQFPSGSGSLTVPPGTLFVYDGSSSDDLLWKGNLQDQGSYFMENGNVYANYACNTGGTDCTHDSEPLAACSSGGTSGGGGGNGPSPSRQQLWLWIVLAVVLVLLLWGGWQWYRRRQRA
jgi:hypothetical protein